MPLISPLFKSFFVKKLHLGEKDLLLGFTKMMMCAVLAVMTACSTQGPVKPSGGVATEGATKESPTEASVAKRVPKFGLALGGGAARGFAHVGVIQVLEEAGLKPDFVVGTSAGSLVAAFYASEIGRAHV